MQTLTVETAALDLDINNPRINPAEHQTEALRSLLQAESIGDQIGEKVFVLAKSICELGSTDPSERLMVMANPQSPGRYTVLDGNRRLAAVRLLKEPALLDREDIGLLPSMRRRLHALRNQYDISQIPDVSDIVVYPSRDEAEPFIRLKHTGELGGAGRSPWSSLQQARFEENGSYQLIQRLRLEQLLNASTLDDIDASRFAITTFERAGASSEFTNRFGGRITSDGYNEGNNSQLALAAWAKIANDTTSGEITSRSLPHGAQVIEYLTQLEESLRDQLGIAPLAVNPPGAPAPTPAPPIPSPLPLGAPAAVPPAGLVPQGGPSPVYPAPVSRPRQPRLQQYLINRRNLMMITHPKCRNIQQELSERVKVADAPYACALLVRSLLEMTAQVYLGHFGLRLTGNMTSNIQALANDLLGSPRLTDEPADRATIGQSLRTEAGAYESLSNSAHNPTFTLSSDHVRATWDSIQPGLALAWRRIYQRPQGGGQPSQTSP